MEREDKNNNHIPLEIFVRTIIRYQLHTLIRNYKGETSWEKGEMLLEIKETDYVDERAFEDLLEGEKLLVIQGKEVIVTYKTQVCRFVEKLKPIYRDTILLKFFGGYSYEEIGELMGVSGKCVKERKHRALRQLNKMIGGIKNAY